MRIPSLESVRRGAEGSGLSFGMTNGKGKGKGVTKQRWDGPGSSNGEEASVVGESSGSGLS